MHCEHMRSNCWTESSEFGANSLSCVMSAAPRWDSHRKCSVWQNLTFQRNESLSRLLSARDRRPAGPERAITGASHGGARGADFGPGGAQKPPERHDETCVLAPACMCTV